MMIWIDPEQSLDQGKEWRNRLPLFPHKVTKRGDIDRDE
jgi:hypothetical protein